MLKKFKSKYKVFDLPIFFPDATRGFIKAVDFKDVEVTGTEGVLVNTYHLYKDLGQKYMESVGGIREFTGWRGGLISDSGGFQVGSLIKKNPELGKITDLGAFFKFKGERKTLLTPESSIRFQMSLGADMVVVLDDFDAPNATKSVATDSVRRTILWAKRAKNEFEKICEEKNIPIKARPYILGVVQGGNDKELRKYCIEKLIDIGFDGLGFGGEDKIRGKLNLEMAEFIAKNTPKNYFLYALGFGKPDDIVSLAKLGFNIFDCVIPTRDARHKRLYTFNFGKISEIDITRYNFYSYYIPDKEKNKLDMSPVSQACDCLLCKNYSRAYLYHLFKKEDSSALRLATIHNLRFYSILMEILKNKERNPRY